MASSSSEPEKQTSKQRISIAIMECMASNWLAHILPVLVEEHSQISIEILTIPPETSRVLADIKLELRQNTATITSNVSSDVIEQRVGYVDFGIFGSSQYLYARVAPNRLTDLEYHDLLTPLTDLRTNSEVEKVMSLCNSCKVEIKTESLIDHQNAATNNLGLAILPLFLTAKDGQLDHILKKQFAPRFELWLISSDEFLRSELNKRVFEFIGLRLRNDPAFHRKIFTSDTPANSVLP